mgnify:CR=1 FL=1
MVKTVSIDPEAIARHKDMKIVYTPIHGTGMMLIPRNVILISNLLDKFRSYDCLHTELITFNLT